MTIEELKQYQHLKNEVRFWQRELEEELRKSYVKSPQLTGLPGSRTLPDITAQRAIETEEITRTVQMMQRRAERKLREIAAFIKQVEDPLIRAVLYGRYVKGLSWNRLADTMGGKNTPDNLRMLHNRFFRKQK